ncbi:hypothetical protein [Pedobacter caeni]|uniref:Uncharacterized protein n=1 Tax=Pedobacter caeni TaxID=288992 RepID=A0A1M4WRS9_9SPHI|nr:hypothetical protein [Pedobacter caeni]SHE83918.1 hypothetical protein SAMN04488522_1011360 [Pedobacter caeni]
MRTNLLFIAASLLLAFSACNKVSESLQRDTIIRPDTILFDIPVITNVVSPNESITNLATQINLAERINSIGGFELKDIVSIKLSGITLTLSESTFLTPDGNTPPGLKETVGIDPANNFANIGSMKVNVTSGTKVDSLAKVLNPSETKNSKLSLTPIISPDSLKAFVNAGNMKYNVILQMKTPTTAVMKAKMFTSYTLTLRK